MSAKATIRFIEKQDEEAWRGLWEQYNVFYKRSIPDKVTSKTFERFLDEKVRMYAAVAQDPQTSRIIGFVTWYPHANTSSIEEVVYLNDLFVDPNVRNGGVGRKLIQHVYDHAKSIPAAKVYWMTQNFNHRAQLLYVQVAQRTDFIIYSHPLVQGDV